MRREIPKHVDIALNHPEVDTDRVDELEIAEEPGCTN